MKKFIKILISLVFVIIFGSTFYFLYKNSKKKPEIYNLVKVYRGDIQRTSLLTGKIEPRDEIFIKSQLSGIISDIFKKPGEFVKVGEKIAQIEVIPDAGKLNEAEKHLNFAKMQFEQEKREFQRTKELHEANFISEEEWEKAKLSLDHAKDDYNFAVNNFEIIKNGVTQNDKDKNNTIISSTVDGVILDILIKKGNTVLSSNSLNEGTSIALIADMQDLIFEGRIDETEIGSVKEGMPMKISVGALPNVFLNAELEFISPKSKDISGSNTFEIKGKIKNLEGIKLRAGYSANASIILEESKNTLIVPENTIEYAKDETFIYILENSSEKKIKKVKVKTGISDGINIEIVEGVNEGDMVRGLKKF